MAATASIDLPAVTRFAPSPTGRLHIGHVHAALVAYREARRAGGRFLLRIEDIDPGRVREEFVTAIEKDLRWLGLDWDGEVRRQSLHLDDYRQALTALDRHGVLYPCFCTRREIQEEIERSGSAPHGPDGPVYPGTCRHLDPVERATRLERGDPHVLRLDMAAALARTDPLFFQDADRGRIEAKPGRFGDVVLARKDVPTSYHLAVTVDDALQGVTLVTRGEDLLDATDVHRLLQVLLGLPTPHYRHHRLLTDPAGRRYAKRDRSLTIESLRESGKSAAEVRAMAGEAEA